MKLMIPILCLALLLASCSDSDKGPSHASSLQDSLAKKEPVVFFPVTSYLEGQIFEIGQDGLNPIRIIKNAKGLEDSAWLKVETLRQEFAEFLEPRIDSSSLSAWFSEKTFLDETLGMITMTYERKKDCPDSLSLREWTVYIDPETDKVKRVYIVKQKDARNIQLTWVSGKYSHMVELDQTPGSTSPVLKDVTIKWSF